MHIHRPKALSGWREISIEIAVIVVGIVIAVGLEQAVEWVHHRDQREQLEAALQRDGRANRAYVENDIASAQTILDWALAEAQAVDQAGPTGPLTLRRMPPVGIESPDAGVWPSARASGVSNLLPSSAQNWLEYMADQNNETFVSSSGANGKLTLAYAVLDEALIGRARQTSGGDLDLSALSADQRTLVADRLHSVAESARGVMRHLLIFDAGNAFILSMPLDQLDTPEAARRYEQIYAGLRNAHPAARFAFSGR